jgi:hypothetical protein
MFKTDPFLAVGCVRINSLNLPATPVFAGVAFYVCITDFTPSLILYYAVSIEVIGHTVKGAVGNLCVYIQIICLKGACLYSSLK